MALDIHRIPTLGDNYNYLLVCQDTAEAAVVDPAEEAPIVAAIEAHGAKLTRILNTHHHWDHTGANQALVDRYGVPVYGHRSDAGRIPALTNPVDEGDVVEVGRARGRVLFIPAHTTGHIAYVFDDDLALFCGDMLFAGGCGRLFEGDASQMYEALCEKLISLPDEMRVYCGHEYTESNLAFALTVEPDNDALKARYEKVRKIRAHKAADWHDATAAEMTIPSTIAEEKATNPFMRAGSAEELGRIRTAKDNA